MTTRAEGGGEGRWRRHPPLQVACCRHRLALLGPLFHATASPVRLFTPPPRSSVMSVMSVIFPLFVIKTKNFLDNPPFPLGLNVTGRGDWEEQGWGGGDNYFRSTDKQEGQSPTSPTSPTHYPHE